MGTYAVTYLDYREERVVWADGLSRAAAEAVVDEMTELGYKKGFDGIRIENWA